MSSDQTAVSETQRRGMTLAIPAQCCGAIGSMAFENGIILLFLTALGTAGAATVVLLSLPLLLMGLSQFAFAYLADRRGKKLFGYLGIIANVVGFLILIAASLVNPELLLPLAAVGIGIYGLGNGMFSAGWFALLSPIVPGHLRGRFFGRLRFSWQLVSILFAAACTLFLGRATPVRVFQVVLLAVTVLLAARAIFYLRIPEMEPPGARGDGFLPALQQVLKAPGYLSFSCYVFLLKLFTGCCVAVFGLIEKRVLNLNDPTVVILANLSLVGALIGYPTMGKAVDRFGTKLVFLGCHGAFGVVLWLYLCRQGITGMLLPWLGLLHFLYGFALAASSIAISTEMLVLIPPANKSVSTSVLMCMQNAGFALSGLLSGWALKLGILQERWQVFGWQMTNYDSILLACACMVVLLVVTLGLVPSISSAVTSHRG